MKKLLLWTVFCVAVMRADEVSWQDSCQESGEEAQTRGCNTKCLNVDQLRVCGNASVGSLTVNGNESVRANLMVSQNATIYGDLTVNGREVFEGDLAVSGDGSFGGNVIITGSLTVGGTQTFNGDLIIDGNICAESFSLCPAAATGTPGVPGIGGTLAYGYFYTTTHVHTVMPSSSVLFYNAGPFAGGITPDGTLPTNQINITDAGVYRLQYDVLATTTQLQNPLIFELRSNSGTTSVPGSQFASDMLFSSSGNGNLNVQGALLASLMASSNLQLVNVGLDTVMTATTFTRNTNNIMLLIERVA